MTPVISPWVFYLMPVCENISFVAWFVAIGSAVLLAVVVIGAIPVWVDDDEKMIKLFSKIAKTLLLLFVIGTLVACLIPNEQTITKMIVAQNVTVERVEMVSDTVVTVYNDIMNLFRDAGATNG